MTTSNDDKYRPMNLGHALRMAGAKMGELADFLGKTKKTISNWIKAGQVPEALYPRIQSFLKRYTHHWMWRFDREPDAENWALEQVIELQREAETLEEGDRNPKLELVLAVLDVQVHPVTREPLEHTRGEALLLDVLRARATRFHSSLADQAEALYLALEDRAREVFEVFDAQGLAAQVRLSRGYVRAAVEARLGYVTMMAERGEFPYEAERDALRQMTRIVEAYQTNTGELVYPELYAKLRWNEANAHCEVREFRLAADPIRDLIRLHSRCRILGLILRDKIIVRALDHPDIAEMLGYQEPKAA